MRDILILVSAIALGLAVQPFADVPNPDYPEAHDVAERLQAAWWSVVQGGVSPEEAAAAHGLHVYFFEVNERIRTVYTDSEPTASGDCYVVRRGPWIGTQWGILETPTSGCTPQPPGVVKVSGSQEEVLPSERITPEWFVPVIVLLSAIGLSAATDASLVLLTKSR